MAKAIAARMQGDDYQGRFFWIQVSRMFEDRAKVVKVELESSNVRSLDDVVVHYSNMFELDAPIRADYCQVKFHVTAHGALTWKGMMDPRFINASSVSLLQRIRNAQQQFAPDGRGCRFMLFTPWGVHPDDVLASLVDLADGRIRLSTLSEGGARSKMGILRAAWREHLGLASDGELLSVLAAVRFRQGPTLDELAEQMNLHLRNAGLRTTQEGSLLNEYDDLARKLIAKGRTTFTRETTEELCRREGLWVGRAIVEPDAIRLGIRSFWQFAENLEDESDATLCLLHHFNGRAIKDPSLWNTAVLPEIERFLRGNTSPSRACHIRIQAHGTIAFLAGRTLGPKSAIDIVPVQDTMQGRRLWRSEPVAERQTGFYPTWAVESKVLNASGRTDDGLVISVSHNIAEAVDFYVSHNLKTVNRIFLFRMPQSGAAAILDGTHAWLLAEAVVSRILGERSLNQPQGTLHVFFAAPNGFVFLLGRLSHSLGSLALYEYDFEAGGAAYERSIGLHPGRNFDPKTSSQG